jgi:MFS family permease
MVLAPTFIVAAVLLGLRTVCSNLGMPARQAYTMGVADERRRGAVAAFSSLPAQATSSISPVIAGALMKVFVDIPVVGAAFFMAANTIAYYLAFRNVPLPGE